MSEVSDAVVEEKKTKKRGPKSKKTDAIVSQEEEQPESNVEVIVPTFSDETPFGRFSGDGELTEDVIDDADDTDDVELTEHFIDNVLFYTNADRIWFDANLIPISSPI